MRKVFGIILIFILILAIYPKESYALRNIMEQGDSFLNDAQTRYEEERAAGENPIGIERDGLVEVTQTLYNIFFTIGLFIAIGVATVLGIQFVIGSAEEKAKIKESLIPFVIGCIVVFGSFGIWRIFIEVGNSLMQ
ncbi:MAG: pilin [Oscillospiraceae bacterium]|nr:pilin [Oscillospiraceae bacterium]